MPEFAARFEPRLLPGAADPRQAALGVERWLEAAQAYDDSTLVRFARDLAAGTEGRAVLDAVFGNSPFLAQCAVNEPAIIRDVLVTGPDDTFAAILADTEHLRHRPTDKPTVIKGLRIARRRVALAVGLADILGTWPLERVTAALSTFADSAVGTAVAHLLREAAGRGLLELAGDDIERQSGYVVLGMGKLGGGELNYSSDIDLIVLYDADVVRAPDQDSLHKTMVRMTRDLVRLLEERTGDGYVFRTDLRLRPDPSSTPPAISLAAASTYYESMGQNWERAAMIKARPVAGDISAGAAFLGNLRPYIWRKYLDFAAIQDIHSIKRQIDAHRGGGTVQLYGHNIKLGRGGIREIEFFAQTQQLIWGGRIPELRSAVTTKALQALADAGRIGTDTATEMTEAYRYLRRVEHRLQMIDDRQTHTLPDDEANLAALATFLGYASAEAFGEELVAHLHKVETHYADLFEDAPSLAAPGAAEGNLVFTGGDPDPETLGSIERLGYRNPKAVDGAIRGWHHGRYRATRSQRARELLTELVPVMLAALARTPIPDEAFLRFDSFLARLPAGVPILSMIHSRPELLELITEVIGKAPRLAEHLARRPSLVDSVLFGDFFAPPPPLETLRAELRRQRGSTARFEETLDAYRRWANDRRFQVGIQFLRNSLAPDAAAAALSDIADCVLGELLADVEAEFARQHGLVRGAAIVVLALGKLGGREMTQTSDLDLVFVYDAPKDAMSDGPRPLAAAHYFARLSQRIIGAITAQTNEGDLYAVDMRLRPSGTKGPIASSLEAYARYHAENAWTWEHMALTRARVVAGPKALADRVEAILTSALTAPRAADALLADVADMRKRMDADHHSESLWDAKHVRGGQVDIEFITQYLALREAHGRPDVLAPNTKATLGRLRDAGKLDGAAAATLIAALESWQGVQAMLRLTIDQRVLAAGDGEIPESLRANLARAAGAPDYDALKKILGTTAADVRRIYDSLVDTPASRLAR